MPLSVKAQRPASGYLNRAEVNPLSLKFFMPTKVCFGRNAVADNASLLRALGSKALVVTGQKIGQGGNGSLRDMAAALQAVDIPYAVYDAISSNPSIRQARMLPGLPEASGPT